MLFNLIMKDILGTPAILVGLFAFFGLILQKKGIAEIVSGTLKTIMGFIILGIGATVLVGALDAFGVMFEHAFHIRGIIPNNEVIVAIAQKVFGRDTALIMLFGMAVNILIARFTRWKYIFLTGHHTMYMACMIAVILSSAHLPEIWLVLVGAVILGFIMTLFPAMLQPFTRKIIDGDDFALGHFNSIGYLVSALVGKYFGNTKTSTEDIEVPKSLGFLRDSSISLAITMTILFIILGLCAGGGFVETKLSGGQNFIVYSLIQAITFAGGVYVILAGVRMLLAEIVPAFKGIADKIVPNAIPALDCPSVFPFAPNAVIIGFFSSFVAGLICMFFFPMLGLLVIVPGLVPHFFDGATAGVFGNATGGRRGAILGALANGVIISFLPAILFPVLTGLGYQGTTFGDADFGAVGVILGHIVHLFH